MSEISEYEAKLEAYRLGFRMNVIYAGCATAVTIAGLAFTGEWYGAWAFLIMLGAVVPSSKNSDDAAEDEA